jgi:hypothetical protein
LSAIIASVVIIKEDTLAALRNAYRTTLVGSITPASNRSPNSPVAALNPKFPKLSLTR